MNLISFFELVGKLKEFKRAGWIYKKVSNPESIADHMYRVALMTYVLAPQFKLNQSKCIKMALVHDLCEAIHGDIADPQNGDMYFNGKKISREEKSKLEEDSLEQITSFLNPKMKKEIIKMFLETEKKETEEGKFVKQLDRLDLAFQLLEYECKRSTENFDEFWEDCESKIYWPKLKKILNELKKKRVKFS